MKLNVYNANIFADQVLAWYRDNGRDYPWRRTRHPYQVLISELMLRRTRADQVVSVFEAFIKQYPNAAALSKGRRATIRRLLKPLGLEWRAENIVEVSRQLMEMFDGEVPSDPDQLMRMSGVGEYVAGAVCCFAYDRPAPMIDTNIVRVIGRVFGLDLKGEARRRKSVRDAAVTCLEEAQPRDYHYAILDFGALVCKAREPNCDSCALRLNCDYAASQGA